MTQINIPYHTQTLTADIPDRWTVEWIEPKEIPAAPDPLGVVQAALENPIGGKHLRDFSEAQTVAIAINDKTRPVPLHHLLPPLLNMLEAQGIAPENITLMIATGTHAVMPPEQYSWILPPAIIERYPILCHDINDEDNLTDLDETSRGTPVTINKQFLNADLRIVVGNVEPHQFMGFSGGVKSAVIGLAGNDTINANHSMMMQPAAELAAYETNPMRQDVEEMGRIVGVHYALNTLLNGAKEIVEVLAGDPAQVMEQAIPRVRAIYEVPVEALDLLILSPGGFPKDINLYQGQKALGHGSRIVKQGGTVILCAACSEGTGSPAYEQWILDGTKHTHEQVFAHFAQEGFRVGPHKAFQISRDASQMQVMLLSQMEPDFVRKLLLHPVDNLQVAVDRVLASLPDDARIGVMPYANSTIPVLT